MLVLCKVIIGQALKLEIEKNYCLFQNYYANYSSLCTAIGVHVLGQICWTMAEYATVPGEELSLLMKKLQKSLPDTLPVSVRYIHFVCVFLTLFSFLSSASSSSSTSSFYYSSVA